MAIRFTHFYDLTYKLACLSGGVLVTLSTAEIADPFPPPSTICGVRLDLRLYRV